MNVVFDRPCARRCAFGSWLLPLALVFAALLQPRFAAATYFPLTDGNSLFEIETQQQAMAFGWTVDGVQHMQELSNWYRISRIGSTNVSNPETSAHLLPIVTEFYNSANSMTVVYTDNDLFEMEITFTILGGPLGSGYSSMGECVRIKNITDVTRPGQEVPIGFHFYEYIDLDLDDTPDDDQLTMITPNRVQQLDLTSGTIFHGNAEADRYELAFFDATLDKLTDGSPSNLSHLTSGWPLGAGPIGPGNPPSPDPPNGTFALQFNFNGTNPLRPMIAPGATAEICKVCELQMPIPEPASLVMTMGGCMLLSLVRRSRD
jgi:hypothetical protein